MKQPIANASRDRSGRSPPVNRAATACKARSKRLRRGDRLDGSTLERRSGRGIKRCTARCRNCCVDTARDPKTATLATSLSIARPARDAGKTLDD